MDSVQLITELLKRGIAEKRADIEAQLMLEMHEKFEQRMRSALVSTTVELFEAFHVAKREHGIEVQIRFPEEYGLR